MRYDIVLKKAGVSTAHQNDVETPAFLLSYCYGAFGAISIGKNILGLM